MSTSPASLTATRTFTRIGAERLTSLAPDALKRRATRFGRRWRNVRASMVRAPSGLPFAGLTPVTLIESVHGRSRQSGLSARRSGAVASAGGGAADPLRGRRPTGQSARSRRSAACSGRARPSRARARSRSDCASRRRFRRRACRCRRRRERVAPVLAEHSVVAGQAVDHVVARTAVERVRAGVAGQAIGGAAAADALDAADLVLEARGVGKREPIEPVLRSS